MEYRVSIIDGKTGLLRGHRFASDSTVPELKAELEELRKKYKVYTPHQSQVTQDREFSFHGAYMRFDDAVSIRQVTE
jgi:hypothetical protein